MYSPIIASTSYPTVSVVFTGRMSEEDRIDLMRFLFMSPTRSVSGGGQEDIGAVDDWFEGDSEVSVPELMADLDDSLPGLDTEGQGKEAVAIGETLPGTQGKALVDQEEYAVPSEEAEESEDQGGAGELVELPSRGAPSLSIKSLTLYSLLGEGGFGQVFATSVKGSSNVHAVKIIPKIQGHEDQTLREQDLLHRLIGCAFFPQLEASWQSSLHYYIVTVTTFPLRC
jgi:hypothetical protein